MIGINKFIAIVRIDSFANYSSNHFDLFDPCSPQSKLTLLQNCNLIGATPVENYAYFTVSNNILISIPTSFSAENMQYIIFINAVLAASYNNTDLFSQIDAYLSYRMTQFWNVSKSTVFKNIQYPGYTYNLLSFATPDPSAGSAISF